MKTVSLSGSSRKNVGKKDAKALRKEGNVPGVIYGGGNDNINFFVKETELNKLVWTPEVYFININIDGKEYKTIIQELQFHPVTDRIVHLDLLGVTEDKPVTIALPVELHGISPGVRNGGKLRLNKRKIKLNGLPSAFPEKIMIDISKLRIGGAIRNAELEVGDLTVIGDPRDVVVAVKTSRNVVADEEEEEEEGAEEATESAEA